MKVLILGGSGMLGNMMAKVLPSDWDVRMTGRWAMVPFDLVDRRWDRFEVTNDPEYWAPRLQELMAGKDWIINCLGSTKPLLDDEQSNARSRALMTNVFLPHLIAEYLTDRQKAIHITTDCVFTGKKSGYDVSDVRDSTDLYGLSKMCGEVSRRGVINLRCSIIGPEVRKARYLLGKAVEGEISKGYRNHYWNGVTTLALTKVVSAMISKDWQGNFKPMHIHAAGAVTKADLCRYIVEEFRRPFPIEETDAPDAITMQLMSADAGVWSMAGYDRCPTVHEMIAELAEFCAEEMWPQQELGWMYWQRR
jgi:dTDP-4-dehydrorhamnose reductase